MPDMVRPAFRTALAATALALTLCVAPAPAWGLPYELDLPSHQIYRRADSGDTHVDGKLNNSLITDALQAVSLGQRSSWVQGTYAATLLELEAPSEWNYFTGSQDGLTYGSGRQQPKNPLPSAQLQMANSAVATQDNAGRLCSFVTGEENVSAGASLDSLSCSVQVLLAAVSTGEISEHKNQSGGGKFTRAAARQLSFVLDETPRLPSGAISQRTSTQQLWSDGIYMASALGLYGVVYDNQTLLQLAYDQMRLYREGLVQPSGLVSHIVHVTGDKTDLSLWVRPLTHISASALLLRQETDKKEGPMLYLLSC